MELISWSLDSLDLGPGVGFAGQLGGVRLADGGAPVLHHGDPHCPGDGREKEEEEGEEGGASVKKIVVPHVVSPVTPTVTLQLEPWWSGTVQLHDTMTP